MRWFHLGCSILMLTVAGCGGTRPQTEPLLQEFASYERDTRALQPDSAAADILAAAQASRDQARALLHKDDAKACTLLLEALGDVRVALAMAQADQARNDAAGCLSAVERSQRVWEDVLHRLIETEQVARRTAEGVSHEVPGLYSLRLPEPPTGEGADAPEGSREQLSADWEVWSDSARVHEIPTADLQQRFDSQLAAAGNDAPALRRAGRTLQELEARVRRELSLTVCARASLLLTDLSAAQDSAQRAMLGLEAGLREGLRAELDEERTRAGDVLRNLQQALQQVAGEAVTIIPEDAAVRVRLGERFFDPKKSTINRKAEFELVRIVTVLDQYPELDIAVEGKAPQGGSSRAEAAAKARAEAVYEFLGAQGMPPQRMKIRGYTGAAPADTTGAAADSAGTPPPAPDMSQGVDLEVAARP
jgi:outer membrane protein OmpA-like peptidoglycan-associated protein